MGFTLTSQVKRDYFWNTASSVMMAGATVIMLLAATRLLGAHTAGTFAFALAMGQLFQMLGAFEVRPFQATDVRHRFTFGTYHAARIVTTLMMLAGLAAVALVSSGWSMDALVIFLVGSLRAFDAFEDVFHGEFQRLGRLDIAGRASFFRNLITTAGFVLVLALTRDLLVTCLVTIAISLIALIALNVPQALRMYLIRPSFVAALVQSLLRTCFPLFLGGFLFGFLTSAPRLGIEFLLDREYQTYFAVLFMPALVINLLSQVMFKPLLTRMAHYWAESDHRAFFTVIRRGLLAPLGAIALTILIGAPFGIPVLGFVFGVDLSAYQLDFLVLLAGGAFNAAGIVLYYALVTMGRRKSVLIGYAAAAAVVALISLWLIPPLGMLGACIAYSGAMLTVALLFGVFFLRWSRAESPVPPPSTG